jgi:serine/threonine protein kinase/Tfp pilus assembly protein PilF
MGAFSEGDVILASEALRLGYVSQDGLQWCRLEMERYYAHGAPVTLAQLLSQHKLIRSDHLQYLISQPRIQGASATPSFGSTKAASVEAPTLGSVSQRACSGSSLLQSSGEQGPHQRLKGLKINKKLAEGGMGAVHSVLDTFLHRDLAMKVSLSRDNVHEFMEEAQITGRLEHPNVIPIHKASVGADGRAFFTMKLVRGETLEQAIKDGLGQEPGSSEGLSRYLEVFLKICDAMAFAHNEDVIHRDLKPENIMLGDFGEVLVMDWGIARVRGASTKRTFGQSPVGGTWSSTINDGELAGTIQYMAPEQAACAKDLIGPRTDIYGLGGILYEILTALPPLEFGSGLDKLAVLKRVMDNRIQPPSERSPGRFIPREVEAIALKALSGDIGARYKTVADLQHDIRLYCAGHSVSAISDSFWRLLNKLIARNKFISALVVVASFAFATIVTWSYYSILEQKNEALIQRDNANSARQKAAAAEERIQGALKEQRTINKDREIEDQKIQNYVDCTKRLNDLDIKVQSSSRGRNLMLGEYDVLFEQAQDRKLRHQITLSKCYGQIYFGRFKAAKNLLKTLVKDGLSEKQQDHILLEIHLARFEKLDRPTQSFIIKMAKKYPESGIDYLLRSLKAKDKDVRLKYCFKAIEKNPRISCAYAIRAGIQSQSVPPEVLIADCNIALRISPNMALAYGNRGIGYSQLKKNWAAIKDLKRSLKIDPKQAYAERHLGYVYDRLENMGEALKHFDRAIQIEPRDFVAHQGRLAVAFKIKSKKWREYAESFRRQFPGRADQFLKSHFTSAVDGDAQKSDELNSLGYKELMKRNYVKAVSLFEEALQHKPRSLKVLLNLADCLRSMKRYSASIEVCQRAAQVDPADFRSFLQMGLCYREIKNFKRAHESFERALRVANKIDTKMSIRAEICVCYAGAGQLEKAKQSTRKLIADYPSMGAPYTLMGQLQERDHKTEEAIASYTKAIKLGYRYGYILRGRLYLNSERKDEARRDLHEALKTEYKPEFRNKILNMIEKLEGK